MSANEDLRDERIASARKTDKYSATLSSMVMKELKKVLDKLTDRISKETDGLRRDSLDVLLEDLKATYADGVKGLSKTLQDEMKKQAEIETERSINELASIPGVEKNLSMPSANLVWSAILETPMDRGFIATEILANFEANTIGKITAAIRQAVIEGDSIQNLVEKLRGTRGEGGILKTEIGPNGKIYTLVPDADGEYTSIYKAADSIARTAVMHVMNTSAAVTFHENEAVLDGVAWSATLDEITCEVCGDLDGTQWDIEDDHPVPPAHRNCRCAIIPVMKKATDMGLSREDFTDEEWKAIDGMPADRISYTDWLKRQPSAVQDEALGKGKAELFRAGTKLEDMSDKGRILTLEELRTK